MYPQVYRDILIKKCRKCQTISFLLIQKAVIAIPYNPYEPKPYQRWTLQGLFDLENEIKVAEEFWNFLGGENTYEQLLDVFETTGLELRPEIDTRFERFNR